MLLYLTLYSILSITQGDVVQYGDVGDQGGDGGPDYHSSTPLGCIALHCAIQSAQCIIDRVCFQTLQVGCRVYNTIQCVVNKDIIVCNISSVVY